MLTWFRADVRTVATTRHIARQASPSQPFAVPPEGFASITAEEKPALCERVIARWLEDELSGETAIVSLTTVLYPGTMSEDEVIWEATGARPSLN